jgi:TPR repeat protein
MTEQEVRYAILQAQDKAEKGDVISQHFLGISFLGLKDLEMAAKWFEKAAEQGYADAQMKLGLQLLTGQGIPEDKVKGIEWIRKAAEQGYTRAQFYMGDFTEDKIKAAEWFFQAAKQGDTDALHELTILAEQENIQAQKNLFFMYFKGVGVPKDKEQWNKWQEKLLKHDPDTQLYMGKACIEYKEYKEAAEWFTKAAEQGNMDAQYELGVLYLNGDGITKDSDKAIKWFNKAGDQGHVKAKEWLEKEKREQEERERKEREHQEWLASEEGQKWQAEEKERKQKEQEERERERERELEEKERQKQLWKIGRIAAPLLTVFSIIMVSVGFNGETNGEPVGMFGIIPLIIPFLVIYFCLGIIKRIIFLIVGIFLAIGWAFNASSDTLTFFITFFISYLISCVLAMINKKDKF